MMEETSTNRISVGSFELPASHFVAPETHRSLAALAQKNGELGKKTMERCQVSNPPKPSELKQLQQVELELFNESPLYLSMKARYDVTMNPDTLGGVYCEVFTPDEGVAPQNKNRVLINIHGGAFQWGVRTASHLESIPIAAVGKINVVSVDYRLAPDHCFPAGSDDVLAVYKALLNDYSPESIGLYGCSAGALLSAQVIAQLQQEGAPLPAVVGLSCCGAYYWNQGDSGHIVAALRGAPVSPLEENPYFKGVAADNPLAFPGNNPDFFKHCPPTVLVSASRDFALSAVIQTHAQLVKAQREAELHIFDGLEHAHLYNADLPQSRDTYAAMLRFFLQHLH